jgi:hypothetical protein
MKGNPQFAWQTPAEHTWPLVLQFVVQVPQ